MKRYFFDTDVRSYIQYDYRGRNFDSPEKALQHAQLVALDVVCLQADREPSAKEVQVRDVTGQHLFSVPIGDVAAAA
jgi:hypothetical protein